MAATWYQVFGENTEPDMTAWPYPSVPWKFANSLVPSSELHMCTPFVTGSPYSMIGWIDVFPLKIHASMVTWDVTCSEADVGILTRFPVPSKPAALSLTASGRAPDCPSATALT